MENKKKNINKSNKISYDLCSSCDNLQNCSYVKNKAIPLYFCEEFSNYIYNKNNIINENKAELIPIYELANNDTKNFKGLCMNCDNKQKC